MLNGFRIVAGFCLPIFEQFVKRNARVHPAHSGQDTADELRVKAIESSGDRSVGRKDIASPRNGQSQIERLCMILHVAVRSFQHCKCSVAFIEMADLRLQAKRAQQTPSADARERSPASAASPHRRHRVRSLFRDAPQCWRSRLCRAGKVLSCRQRPPSNEARS